jgi:hypothetical protein
MFEACVAVGQFHAAAVHFRTQVELHGAPMVVDAVSQNHII